MESIYTIQLFSIGAATNYTCHATLLYSDLENINDGLPIYVGQFNQAYTPAYDNYYNTGLIIGL